MIKKYRHISIMTFLKLVSHMSCRNNMNTDLFIRAWAFLVRQENLNKANLLTTGLPTDSRI